jgi:rubrerythrin
MKEDRMGESDLAKVLREAMEAERDGFTFYTMAAERSEDPGARETFARLADEERKHYEALQSGYRSLTEGGTWVPSDELLEDREPEASGIFSEDFVRRIGGKHLEMSALSIGILLEKNAYAFYTRQADAAEDEAVAGFFRELAEWEDGHYRLLLRQDEALKEEYWNENRFAPLL